MIYIAIQVKISEFGTDMYTLLYLKCFSMNKSKNSGLQKSEWLMGTRKALWLKVAF